MIKDQIKANNASVVRNVEGWTHGNLELVLTNIEYANITATPYIFSVYPDLLLILVLLAHHVDTYIQEDHEGLIRVFGEVVNMENATTFFCEVNTPDLRQENSQEDYQHDPSRCTNTSSLAADAIRYNRY